MYSVLDVSRFVINYCNEKEYSISNLKLQKLLYFVQAYFVVVSSGKTPCFYEKIEAWDFGPVVPEAYHEYKPYGSSNIPYIKKYLALDKNNIWGSKVIDYNDNLITEKDKSLIREVVDKFAPFSTTRLVSITHRQSPWIDAYHNEYDKTITLDAIRDYFNG